MVYWFIGIVVMIIILDEYSQSFLLSWVISSPLQGLEHPNNLFQYILFFLLISYYIFRIVSCHFYILCQFKNDYAT